MAAEGELDSGGMLRQLSEAGALLENTAVQVALVCGLLAVAILFGIRSQRRRTAALERGFLTLGLAFRRKDPELQGEPCLALPLFQRGRSHRFTDVARGDDMRVFEFKYATGSGKRRSVRRQTVAALRVGAVPTFQLDPEGWFDRLGSSLGGQDIDFEGDPGFSKRYRLRAPSEPEVRARFHPGLRQWLAAEPGWSLEGEGDWVIVFRPGRRVDPADLAGFVSRARELAGLLAGG